jgi:hypothetical protein
LLKDSTQGEKEMEKKISDLMQATIELAFAQHPGDVVRGGEKKTRSLEVTAKMKSSNNGSSHNFSIGHRALMVFSVMKSLQQVITKAVYCKNLVVHWISPFKETLVDGQSFVNCQMT